MDKSAITLLLEESKNNQQPLTIAYHGGSHPGTIRKILPVRITGEKVRALCSSTNMVKTFVISKIEVVEKGSESEGTTWSQAYVQEETFNSLQEIYTAKREDLLSLGWHIQFDLDSLSLHRTRKNGKPLIGHDVWINYEEYTSDSAYDVETQSFIEVDYRKRIRPYSVRAKGEDTKSYSNLNKAAALFLAHADKLAPGNK